MAQSFPRFGEIAGQLVANGYRPLPIPLGQKSPGIDAWPDYIYDGTEHGYDSWGTGIICGSIVGLDIDVRVPEIAAQMRAYAEENLGLAPARIGQAPKVLLVYQVLGDPFKKLQTASYRLHSDQPDDDAHKVEVLAQGQQFVGWNRHQKTGKPYTWNGHGDLLDTPAARLSEVTREQLVDYIQWAEAILSAAGRPLNTQSRPNLNSAPHVASGSQRANDVDTFRSALHAIPNSFDYDEWVKMAYAIKGALGDAGHDDWMRWSATSAKHQDKIAEKTWRGVKDPQSGAGTVFHLAMENGWRYPARTNVPRATPHPSVNSSPQLTDEADNSPFAPTEAYLDEQRHELVAALDLPAPTATEGPVTVKDFQAYMPTHTYLFAPTGELWPSSSVNARCERPIGPDGQPATMKVPRKGKGGAVVFEDVPIPPATWLDKNHPVEQMTWVPGEPPVIRDRLINNGGWMERPGCNAFNLYHAPSEIPGDPEAAEPWREHLQYLFGSHAPHITKWLAHRVQKPGEKINHALVLGGNQGIGKDSILEPVKYAIGPWNFVEVSPSHLLGRFNGFVKSVILRVSEARDLGDVDRYAFYDHTKIYTAAPPDVLRCDEKNLREHNVLNVCGVIITSNHKQDGIYLPADDRRHYVAWSDLSKEEFDVNYWNTLWTWYRKGGIGHVTAYLKQLDLSDFDPKAPPPKTDAFWEIVNANRASEDAEMSDVLDLLGSPPAITLQSLESRAEDAFREWLLERKNRRQVPHRLETAGYIPVRNTSATDGLWKVRGKRKVIYARRELSTSDRMKAATAIASDAIWVDGAWFHPSR